MCFNRSIRGYVSIRYMVRGMIYCCFSFSHAQNKKFSKIFCPRSEGMFNAVFHRLLANVCVLRSKM